jgi:cysteine synthase
MIPITVVEITDPRVTQRAPGSAFYTTLQGENPTGSIKDHMVAGELDELLRDGKVKPGDQIGEATFGSTGRSLAQYTKQRGLRCVLFLPDFVPAGDLEQLRAIGAEVHTVPLAQGMELYEAHCAKHGIHKFNQWTDPGKRRHYRSVGEVVLGKAKHVDVVIGAVGTGFSLIGTWEGMAGKPECLTAEPATGEVFAVRNIERAPHGPGDPCTPESFAGRRVLLDESQYFPATTIETSAGPVECSESFRLSLGAALDVAGRKPGRTHFVVDAANRRKGS